MQILIQKDIGLVNKSNCYQLVFQYDLVLLLNVKLDTKMTLGKAVCQNVE